MQHILIIDDDKRICVLLSRLLKRVGFEVTMTFSAEEAKKAAIYFFYDAIITDVKMKHISGIELTHQIRQSLTDFDPLIPVMMISAGLETEQRITGLKQGADDYIVKPFEPEELIVRLETLLRRASQPAHNYQKPEMHKNIIRSGEFTLLKEDNILNYQKDKTHLSPSEVNILSFFMQNPNVLFSRDTILSKFFPEHQDNPQSRAVDVMIARLRRKIDVLLKQDMPHPLITKRSEGYIWRM